jgi:hypothetical protein
VTAAGGPAHVVSADAELHDGRFRLPAGRTTRANAAAQATVTLLWAPAPGGPYSLIVDGEATVDGDTETVEVVPTRAVLHRMAGADPELPTCREVG